MADLIDRVELRERIYSRFGQYSTKVIATVEEGRVMSDWAFLEPFLNAVPAVNRWIPCSERMPENCTKVLVWFEYFRYGEYNCMYSTWGIGEYFDFSGRWLIDDSTGWQDLHVFAWMPLPEPPEKE